MQVANISIEGIGDVGEGNTMAACSSTKQKSRGENDFCGVSSPPKQGLHKKRECSERGKILAMEKKRENFKWFGNGGCCVIASPTAMRI